MNLPSIALITPIAQGGARFYPSVREMCMCKVRKTLPVERAGTYRQRNRPLGAVMLYSRKGTGMDDQPFAFVEAPRDMTTLSLEQEFPADLAGLSLVELQVLHSRICHQLDHEYLIALGGPHPLTLDRYRDLIAQLDVHDGSTPEADR